MPETKTETENTLENFEGFNNESEIDFFESGPAEDIPIEKVVEEIETDDITGANKDKPTVKETTIAEGETKVIKGEEEETEDINFFETTPEPGADPDDPETIIDEKLPKVVSHIGTLTYLKDKGLIDYELEDKQELTEELAEQIVEDNFDERVEGRVDELFSELPQAVKDIVKYANNGGDVNHLLSSMAQKAVSPITSDMDMEDEANQMLVVKTQRITDGDDAEMAEAYVDFLKESGKLKGVAGKVHTTIIASDKKANADKLAAVAGKRKQDKINQRKFKNELAINVTAANNLNGLVITKVDKRELPNYMADRTVKLEDGRQVTAMQRDLFIAMGDKDKSLILAKLLKNGFDFSNIQKVAKTELSKKVRRDITRSKLINNTVTETPNKKKDLASYF